MVSRRPLGVTHCTRSTAPLRQTEQVGSACVQRKRFSCVASAGSPADTTSTVNSPPQAQHRSPVTTTAEGNRPHTHRSAARAASAPLDNSAYRTPSPSRRAYRGSRSSFDPAPSALSAATASGHRWLIMDLDTRFPDRRCPAGRAGFGIAHRLNAHEDGPARALAARKVTGRTFECQVGRLHGMKCACPVRSKCACWPLAAPTSWQIRHSTQRIRGGGCVIRARHGASAPNRRAVGGGSSPSRVRPPSRPGHRQDRR